MDNFGYCRYGIKYFAIVVIYTTAYQEDMVVFS